MKNIWKAVIALGAFIAVSQCLSCQQCSIGVLGRCLFPSVIECDNGTLNCYTGEAQFNGTGAISLHTRGCMDSDLCEKTLTGSILGAGFTASFACCQTDLCNGASAVQLSLTAALSAAMFAVMGSSFTTYN